MRKPFKGLFFYEWQIGPIVFQWRHNDLMRDSSAREIAMRQTLPQFKVWRDRHW